jgi:hypothetical protein
MRNFVMAKPSRFSDEQADMIAAIAVLVILAATAIYWVAGA